MRDLIRNKRVKMTAIVLIIAILAICFPIIHSNSIFTSSSARGEDVLLIDPGHGGFDGGAESADGVPEKDINLAISQKIKALAEKDGWTVVMTRETDTSLDDGAHGAIRSKKTADIANRRKLIKEVNPCLTISIHLNSFKEDKTVKGAQVFYPATPKTQKAVNITYNVTSKQFAEAIQQSLIDTLQDGTNRKAMEKDGIGILRDANTPVVLVECGFLSNNEEARLLQSSEYQNKISQAVYCGVMKALGKKGENIERIRIVDSLTM